MYWRKAKKKRRSRTIDDHAAVLAVPDGVVLLEMLDEKAGRRDVVAVDHDAVAADVGHPPLVVAEISAVAVLSADDFEALNAVVGSPHPGVVDEDAVAVDLEGDVALADVRAADAEVHVAERRRVQRIGFLGQTGRCIARRPFPSAVFSCR